MAEAVRLCAAGDVVVWGVVDAGLLIATKVENPNGRKVTVEITDELATKESVTADVKTATTTDTVLVTSKMGYDVPTKAMNRNLNALGGRYFRGSLMIRVRS